MNDGGETAGSELRLRAEVQLRRYDCVADISKALYLKNRILEEETKNSLLLWLYTRPALLRSLLCEHGWKLTLGQPHGKGTQNPNSLHQHVVCQDTLSMCVRVDSMM